MPRCLRLRNSPVERVVLHWARSARDVLRWTGLIPLAILLCSSLSLKAGNVVWTLNATFADGGTAVGVFTSDSGTGTVANWNVSTAGGNTSIFLPFDFTPANSISFLGNRSDPSAPVIQFRSNALFPDAFGRNLVLEITAASTLSDAGGAINISPGTAGASSYECFNCSPYRLITNGTVTGQPVPDLSVVVTDNSSPYNPARSTFTQGQSGGMYAITVSNVGSATTSGAVTVTNSLTTGLVATTIGGTGWTCVLATLSCTRGDSLAASASYPVISVAVTVSAGAPGGVTNTVSVSGGGDTNASNDTAGDYTTTFTEAQLAGAWSPSNAPASLVGSGAALLMTDGTVMVGQGCTSNWYRLTPDNFGNYAEGTWSQAASMPPGYAPFDFSSAVLADGRLVVIGGEYNNSCSLGLAGIVFTNLGAIYDPTANIWTPLPAPSGWTSVGDAPNVVLPDGQFLLAGINNGQVALLDPVTLTWTNLNGAPPIVEAGWTLLPDGTVLMPGIFQAPESYRYLPQTNTWVQAGNTVATLVSFSDEIGPQVLRPDGTVFVAGATGQTAIYNVAAGTWAAGPDFPGSGQGQLVSSDAPGSLTPSGNVLVEAQDPQSVFFFEFDGTHLNPVPTSSTGCFSLLLLPTGQILCGGSIYTPTGSPNPDWAPTIATAPTVVQPGLTFAITGTQFNGLSQAVGYGDDYQGATNYPLVRIVNTATGHVFYCRTHNHSTMGIATGAALVSTQFDIPPSIEKGFSTLVVIANGIASSPWTLTVATNPGSEPVVSSLSPSSTIAGGAPFTLTVNGTGFVTGATVSWNGTSLATTFVGATQLTAAVPAALVATAGTTYVVVTDSVGPSNSLAFTIQVKIASTAPQITGVTDSAGYQQGISPGAWITIWGANLATTTRNWRVSEIVGGMLPTLLDGVSVTIDGKPSAVNFISPGQLNVQVPDDTTAGAVQVAVTTSGGTATATATMQTVCPGLFMYDATNVAAQHVGYSIVAPAGLYPGSTPARPSEVIILYATGFGATLPPTPSGQIVPSAPVVDLSAINLTIGGRPAQVQWAGIVGAGLWQLNVQVPADVPAGNAAVVAHIGGKSTQGGAFIAIQIP
jgi:uncharacterized protein (TIGR03437 family)